MQKWEYFQKQGVTIAEMNELGEDEWELVSVASDVAGESYSSGYVYTRLWYTFKRPKP